ncbi:PhzF family phenazine biosynthesis protein [Amnibacterium kyonggiense]|uniref:PhzF family phenazine biosynthesis protein n=1 Tax=Amnibacterium kyonggiense TaxID=595671 RepID=A0A4R7FPD6_9MICO|nr:PhzF family phenazine biosynthesis protein [Amnibacterium kyonggiense]TDS79563.1 PhzF family phenazine biosynthesis protein [Amnibacterium kyonggiense]
MSARERPFRQVDVFPGSELGGNPVAVVLDADGLDDAAMRAFARWTNLSETTFVLPPSLPEADYRLRIFTPTEELPFAGHPTLGSAHAVAEHRGSSADRLVQECGVGAVPLRRAEDGWAFAAPDLRRSGPATDDEVARIAEGLGIGAWDVLAAEWVDNGPGWVVAVLGDAASVLEIQPDLQRMRFPTGVIGPHPAGGPADFEVRAFVPGLGVDEDPVTGSLNAGIATWFFASGRASGGYTVRQGARVGADGLVRVTQETDGVWIAGATRTILAGTAAL